MILKELRTGKKLLQKDVADFLGVAPTTYLSYEKGIIEPSLDKLCRLADFFDVTVDELLGRKTQGLFDNAKVERPEILEIYDDLTPAQQNNLLNYARGMAVSNAIEAESRESKRKKA